MKTYKEMADDALDRISQYETERKNKRKKFTKIAVPAFSCCLVAVICIGMWQSGALQNRIKPANTYTDTGEKTHIPEENERSNKQAGNQQGEYENKQNQQGAKVQDELDSKQAGTKTDNVVIASDDKNTKGPDASSIEDFCMFWWKNKISMYGDLYWAINDNPDGTFAVTAKYRPTPQNVTDFTYEGKTLYQLAVDADSEKMMPAKMVELLKVGDELKYGTALYETGGPDGIKWDRALYEERVAYFGDLLDKYIVNGEFLADALQKDIEEYNETSAAGVYKLAYKAYLETVLPETEKILSENNIKCERAPYTTDSLNIVVTAEELENLPLEHIEFWVFGLTNNSLKGSQPADNPTDLTMPEASNKDASGSF